MKRRETWRPTSRRRVLLVALGLFLLLDLGRSLYARTGYARPLTLWQPNPAEYADLAWPPGADLATDAPADQRIYAERCAVCHGPDGRGNGPAAPSLIPRPRDFTLGLFKYKSTPAGQPPSDADLFAVVANGLPASAMPYWNDLLSDDEIGMVVEYVKGFSPAFGGAAPEAIEVPPRPAADAASVERGRGLFDTLGCAGCHGADGKGGTALADAKGYPVVSRDLSAPWTFRGGSEPEQIWLRLTTGLAPGPMPSFAEKTTSDERWDVVNYVLSLARTPAWEPGGAFGGPGFNPDPVRRGQYLVRAEICGLCHTQINPTGIYRGDDAYLAGGMRVGAYPHGMLVSRNLTSDPETGLGNWKEEEIANAIRNGRSGGRVLNVFDMPWVYLHSLSQDDAEAIGAYLKTLPPVYNRIPAPLRYGVVETVIAKLTRPLPAVPTTLLTFAEGNFGQADGGLPRDWPQRLLVLGQWLVAAGAVVGFFLARPPRRKRGWVLAGLGLLGLGACGLIGSAITQLPQLTVIPPEQITAGFEAGVPQTDAAAFDTPEQVTLAERGRYIYVVASCALCHGGDGAGGSKISWRPFGTLWTRNITPDLEAGIGQWSDAEIARAIRSGVSADGRALHWQGMIWDHASNWDEEDLRAVIAYLRALPPVSNAVPAPRPPASDDCVTYTFWTSENREPGCVGQ